MSTATNPAPVIAVAGQPPPPHHGQAIMIDKLLDGDYPRSAHVRAEDTYGNPDRPLSRSS